MDDELMEKVIKFEETGEIHFCLLGSSLIERKRRSDMIPARYLILDLGDGVYVNDKSLGQLLTTLDLAYTLEQLAQGFERWEDHGICKWTGQRVMRAWDKYSPHHQFAFRFQLLV